MSDTALLTTFVTQLDETSSFTENDYFLVSKLSGTGGDYVSQKMSGAMLSSAMSSQVKALVDDYSTSLSNAISANTDAVSALQSQMSACESAIVKIANCVYKAKEDIQTIVDTLDGVAAWHPSGVTLCGQTLLESTSASGSVAARSVEIKHDGVFKIGNTSMTEEQLSSLLNLLNHT